MAESADATILQQWTDFRHRHRVLLALLSFLLIGVLGVVANVMSVWDAVSGHLRSPNVEAMSGDLNVAVIEFSVFGSSEPESAAPIARNLSQSVFTQLEAALRVDRTDDFDVQASDPSGSGSITASSPAARAEQLKNVARGLQADVVIGANVVIADNRTVVTPELYVADAKSRDAEELAGYHSLSAISQYGRPDDNPAVRRAIRRALLQEVRGAASFVLGLGLYNRGEFQEASARFTAALDSWTDDRERALAYLFLGNTAGRRDDLSQARTYYRKAMQVSPDYVRASLGLAELAYQEGHGTCERKSIDAKKLLSALERYKAISDQLQQTSTLSLKATFGAGRVHLCLSQSGTRSAWAEAEKAFRMVASATDTSQRVQELASESYASLGLIYMPPVRAPQPEPYYRRAEQAYRKAVELSPSAARQALFLSIIGHIQERLGDAQEACKAYHRASSLDPSRAEYTASRRRLDGCQ